jgi:hypothetical protein
MYRVLYAVGIVLVILSITLGIYGFYVKSTLMLYQSFLILCNGSAFIIIRNLVLDSKLKDLDIQHINRKVNDLRYELAEMQKEKASLQ